MSSEFPFAPGAQQAIKFVRAGKLGRVLEIHSGFLHSSDLDPDKPANWKRQAATCGEIGVMGDLGTRPCPFPPRLETATRFCSAAERLRPTPRRQRRHSRV